MQPEEIEIRPHTKQDIPLISSMITRCISDSCKNAYDSDGLNYWAALYSEENFCEYTKGWGFWVLCDERAKIKGCIGLKNNELKGLFVEPLRQGAGLGKKLLEFAESHAKEKGAKKIILDASSNAVQFYEKNGYCMLGKRTYSTGIQNRFLEVVMMEKEIDE